MNTERLGIVQCPSVHLPWLGLVAYAFSLFLPLAVYQAGDITGAKTIINVHNHNIGCTAVQHGEKRGKPAE